MTDKPTPITELDEYFHDDQPPKQAKVVTLVAPRFWKPGDTYQQAMAKQDAYMASIKAKRGETK